MVKIPMSLKAKIISLTTSSNNKFYMLDTNAIVYALAYDDFGTQGLIDATNAEHIYNTNSFESFFSSLAINNNVGLYTSVQSGEIFNLCQRMVAENFKRNNRLSGSWNKIYKDNPSLVSHANALFSNIESALSSPSILKIEDSDYDSKEVETLQRYILSNTAIETNDAKIIAIAMNLGVNSIVTAEYQMGCIDGLNVISNNKKLLAERTNSDTDVFDIGTSNKVFGIVELNDEESP